MYKLAGASASASTGALKAPDFSVHWSLPPVSGIKPEAVITFWYILQKAIGLFVTHFV